MPEHALQIIDLVIGLVLAVWVAVDAYKGQRYGILGTVLWAAATLWWSLLAWALYLLFRRPKGWRVAVQEQQAKPLSAKACQLHQATAAVAYCRTCGLPRCADCFASDPKRHQCGSCVAALDRRCAVATKAVTVIALLVLVPSMFLIAVIVPKFREIFAALGGKLPLMTQSALFLSQYAWIVGAAMLTAVAVFRMNRSVQAWCRRRAPWSYVFAGFLPVAAGLLLLTYTVIGLFLPVFQISKMVHESPAEARPTDAQ